MRHPKIVTTLQTYSWPLFAGDLVAGMTVAMVAMPLSIAIAIASGADPAKGLVTAIVGGFLISLLSGRDLDDVGCRPDPGNDRLPRISPRM